MCRSVLSSIRSAWRSGTVLQVRGLRALVGMDVWEERTRRGQGREEV